MDLIDRQALISEILGMTTFGNVHELDNFVHKCHLDGEHMGGLRDAVFAIVNAPSVQPDIIHCKDCKHWMPYDWMFSEVWQSKNMDDYPEDEIGCAYCDMNMGANDFCSRPERRTDD